MPLAADHIHHFAMGTWLLFFAYLVSVVGSVVGLACTLQARTASGGARIGWLAGASISIGGVGIWLMHFIAMLGFDTPGMPVRYDIGRTAISALLSVSAVFVGLLLFGVRARYSVWRLLLGGLIMGLAVNLMHYTGMWALEIQGTFSYDRGLVALSVVIAVVAATAALWFTVLFDRVGLRVIAGAVMGVAVTGMHYTGMAAIRVTLDPEAPAPGGVEVFTFLFPVFVLAVLALAVPIYAVLMSSTWAEDPAAPPPVVAPEAPPGSRPDPRSSGTRRNGHAISSGLRGVGNLARQPEDRGPGLPIRQAEERGQALPTRRPPGERPQ